MTDEPLPERSVRTLAWLGDAEFEREVRVRLARRGDFPTDRLHAMKARVVCAEAQAELLATLEPVLVVAGFLVVGLALSAVVPVAFSVAGDLAPERAGGAISVVTTLGYGGFLFGPVLVGGLAEILGLRVALGTIAVAGALIFALSLRLVPSEQLPTPGEDQS